MFYQTTFDEVYLTSTRRAPKSGPCVNWPLFELFQTASTRNSDDQNLTVVKLSKNNFLHPEHFVEAAVYTPVFTSSPFAYPVWKRMAATSAPVRINWIQSGMFANGQPLCDLFGNRSEG